MIMKNLTSDFDNSHFLPYCVRKVRKQCTTSFIFTIYVRSYAKKKLSKLGRKFYLIKSCPILVQTISLFGQGIW